ncbi:MAG TPA: c-type cytochrome domain-containing protein [Gemmataceae bacterium]|jgi:serine/threonine-protein kinase|nr:c-type cytochrome domain-containing protein [Gemmataceae bacterium]
MCRLSLFATLIVAGGSAVAGDADLAARVKEVFRAHCVECHGLAKARAGVNVLDRDGLIKKEKMVPGKPDDSVLFQLITATDESAMPPTGRSRLTTEQVEAIRKWIAAGAPAFPADAPTPPEPATEKDKPLKEVAGVDYVLKKILAHVRAAPAHDRPFLRFFSINHVLTAGATAERLAEHRAALIKAINHLSREPGLAQPKSIDAPTDTVFALDVRELGWHRKPFKAKVGDKETASDLTVFDLALLEYPYAIAYADSETFDRLAEEFLNPANQVRPIAYLRADWFCSVVTQPPLYEDFLQLPFTLAELEKDLEVDAEADLAAGTARRAGMTVSGVSRNNRVVERHAGRTGMYWKSFDFRTSKGPENILKDPITFHPSGGEMIFRLPNGLQAYYVADGSGQRLDAAPTEIVTDKFAADKTVRNGLACIRCHDQGIKEFVDTVRPSVAALPGSPGFDRRAVLELYPPQERLDALVKSDRAVFQAAMTTLLGRAPAREPLVPVTTGYLDDPLSAIAASAELGLVDGSKLADVLRTPQFAGLGLAPLAAGGVVRRDAWEDNYDQVVRALGLGTPFVAIDGVLRRDHAAGALGAEVELKTNKPNNLFESGDELMVSVANKSAKPIHIELVGTSNRGRKVLLTSKPVVIKPGETFKLDPIAVKAGIGREQITLFASPDPLPPAELLRGNGVTDRVVHRFYKLTTESGRIRLVADAAAVVKKTIDIETR